MYLSKYSLINIITFTCIDTYQIQLNVHVITCMYNMYVHVLCINSLTLTYACISGHMNTSHDFIVY